MLHLPPTRSYYQASATPAPAHPPLQGEVRADVCVVGGGVAGCSTALHLAQRGYRVVLLESEHTGFGASGRSGGQLLPGYSSEQGVLVEQLGLPTARQLWDVSTEAVRLCRELIGQHRIECDLQSGHLLAAVKPRHRATLQQYQQQLIHDYGYHSTRLIDRDELASWVGSSRYQAALHDSAAAHLHPLNYTLGLARAAVDAGVVMHEHSPVTQLVQGTQVAVMTAQGKVIADHVALCCNTGIGSVVPALAKRIMCIATYIIATEPLGRERAAALLPHRDALSDCNFILDYFRLSADDRLLFGGRVSYSGQDFRDTAHATRQRMLKVFPQLRDARVEYAWGGDLDITRNRAPDFGYLQPNVLYLQGFSGHGMALATMAGKLVAEAVAGQRERLNLFTRIRHSRFPGGPRLRVAALVLAMLWYRLRDAL